MGADNVGSKSFFNIFHWNRKSVKRLLSHGNERNQDNGALSTSNDPDNEDQMVALSSPKGTSVYSCSSSEKSIRGPGVVARLMGLDSMPASASTPFYDSVTLGDDASDTSSHSISTFVSNAHSGQLQELRSLKLSTSPFERFHMETLPPRLVRPPSQRNSLSPLGSSHRSSRKVGAANKILEWEFRNGEASQSQFSMSPSSNLKVHDSQKTTGETRKSKPVKPPRESVEAGVHKSFKREVRSGSFLSSEKANIAGSVPHSSSGSSIGTKGKDKAASLAVQAKLNIERRDETIMKSDETLGLKTSGESSLNKSSYQTGSQRHIKNKRSMAKNASGVVKPNIQKHSNTPNRSSSTTKASTPSQQGSKMLLGDSSNSNKVSNKVLKNGKHSSGKAVGSQTAKNGKETLPSNNKYLPRNKRMVETKTSLEINESIDNVPASRHGKEIRHIIVLDENCRPSYNNVRSSSDVVSFTFTSPIKSSIQDLLALSNELATRRREIGYPDPHCEDNVDLIAKDSSSHLDAEEGDSLGNYIEKKLKELTYGAQSPYLKGAGETDRVPSLFSSSLASHSGVYPFKNKMESVMGSGDEEIDGSFHSSTSITIDNESNTSRKLEEYGTDSCSNIPYMKQIDHQDQSPLSILENSFSNESCSSESWEYSTGSKVNCSSVLSQEIDDYNLMKRASLTEQEPELSDSTSALSIQTADGTLVSELCQEFHHNYSCNVEVDYVKEILINRELMFGNFMLFPTGSSSRVLAPVIFEKLEESISFITADEEEEKDCRMERKMLFDSVNEYLELLLSNYFQSGYRGWEKGIAAIKKDFAEDIYEEISGWSWLCIGDWMVDELVEKDMSTYLGKWTNFEIEAFEMGVEIEIEVLNSLIDELAAELVSKPEGVSVISFPS